MCLMRSMVIKFNTWYSFFEALSWVKIHAVDKGRRIHGQIILPIHVTFMTLEEFNQGVREIIEFGKESLPLLKKYGLPNNLLFHQCKDPYGLPSIYGEVTIEITDPWLR